MLKRITATMLKAVQRDVDFIVSLAMIFLYGDRRLLSGGRALCGYELVLSVLGGAILISRLSCLCFASARWLEDLNFRTFS